ncbi:uncharacterized protein C8Q71DRAFT_72473 [Rhodofomes roseus]|uniref:RRM domain-containing protein n=1 Tax=Rhodofomes roseus TaxID=34475 RepID=A0ABQ8KEU1_9APHY|nr:uncharacterized protein C8Q71DRAFT_72473 [Rhodofomes roseus]KAH9836230.1 hypothetical protein C8Q71DRAFT_72473 [Rhodofomes roseus]
MAGNGNGSLSSPIVISDDEDAALVERELGGFEARLTDPEPGFEPQMDDVTMYDWGQQELYPSSDSLPMNGFSDVMQAPAPVAGQKRKRKQNMQAGPSNAVQGVQESKNQRKKRRRAERLAAQDSERVSQEDMQVSSSAAPYTRPKFAPLPDRPVATYHDPQHKGILPPVSWTASFSAHTAAMPQSFMPALPLKPSPSTSSFVPAPESIPPFTFPAAIPQIPERHQPPHIPSPASAPHIPLPKPPPLLVTDAAPVGQGPAPQKKLLGTARENDKTGLGLFSSELLSQPPPDPTRTLVLAPIPRKFRNPEFVRHWANRFSRPMPIRVEVDKTSGKALVEFQNVALADMAFGSQRMAGEGKEHIRAWWYREPAKNPSDLEEGEIEEGIVEAPVVPQAQPTSKKKLNKKEKKARKAQAASQMVVNTEGQRQAPHQPLSYLPRYPSHQSTADRLSVAPMPVPLPIPPLTRAGQSTNAASKAPLVPALQPPQPDVLPPSKPKPFAYRGWAGFMDRSETYRVLTDDEDSEDEGPSPEAERSLHYYAGSRQKEQQEEEQAMDLESDDEAPIPPEEPSPDSRYAVWGESAMAVDVSAADSASIASSRAGSIELEHEKMRVDDTGPSVPAAAQVEATTPSAPKLPSSPGLPKPYVPIPQLQTATSPVKPLSPSAFTMVEPPGAVLAVSSTTTTLASPKTSESARSIAVAPSAILTNEVPAPNPVSAIVPTVTRPDVSMPQPAVSQEPSSEQLKGFVDISSSVESALPSMTASTTVEPSPIVVHAKRSLLEKQRELEERIARAKEELARRSAISRASTSRHTSPEEEQSKPAPASNRVAEGAPPNSTEMLSAQELRRSALQSRRKVGHAAVASTGAPQQKESAVASSDTSATSTVVGDDASGTTSAPKAGAINFDELAVSFITETLQTVKPSPPSDTPQPPDAGNLARAGALEPVSHSVPSTAPATQKPTSAAPHPLASTQSHAPVKSNQTTAKTLLAAKHKRLEQHIAETKVLMAKLGTTRSKAEKENILRMLREQQR